MRSQPPQEDGIDLSRDLWRYFLFQVRFLQGEE